MGLFIDCWLGGLDGGLRDILLYCVLFGGPVDFMVDWMSEW